MPASVRASVTPTITAGAYGALDVVGGMLTFNVSGTPQGGILNRVIVVDDDNEKAVLTLYLFGTKPSTIADNAAFTPAVADLKALFAKVAIAADNYVTLNSNAIAIIDDVNCVLPANNGQIYGYLVCTATPTYTATSDLTITIDVLAEGRN